MENHPIPQSDWDGQLPPYISKNVEIWWEIFPSIRPLLPSKLFRLFGGAKESPSRETIGKIVLIADTKQDFKFAPLLNDWGCFCALRKDRNSNLFEYMSGTVGLNLPPNLIFDVPWGLFASVFMRFIVQVDKSLNLSEMERHDRDVRELKSSRELGIPIEKSSECAVSISKYQHGSWEKGLDIAFKAAIWVNSNQEEALTNLWKIRNQP